MSQATWRGFKVEVLSASTVRAVIITPLGIRLAVSVHEIRTVRTGPRPKKDSRKF